MKRLRNYAIALSIALSGMGVCLPDADCNRELQKLQAASLEFANSPSFYVSYSCTNVFDGVANAPIVARYWKDGNKMQFLSEAVDFYSDGKTLVRVLDPIAVVVIQNMPQKADPGQFVAVDPQAGIDSLRTHACAVGCSQSGKTGKISFDFLQQKGKYIPYRSVVIQYDLDDGNIIAADYSYFPDQDGVVQEDKYVFLKRVRTRMDGIFSNAAIDQVMKGPHPKAQYVDYEFQDLRSLATNITK